MTLRIAAIAAICVGVALCAFDRTGASDTLQQRGAYLVIRRETRSRRWNWPAASRSMTV
jgi:hypothetical protein